MSVLLDGSGIESVSVGGVAAEAVYVGSRLVWPEVVTAVVEGSADSVSDSDTSSSSLIVPSAILGTVVVPRPRDVAVVGNKVYVTENNRPGAVHVFHNDDFTQPAIKLIPVDGPYKIGVAGTRLFVTANSGVDVIDTTTDTVVNTIRDAALTNTRFGIPYGNKMYVGDFNTRSVVVIDIATESIIKVITGFGTIVDAVVVGTRMFVLNNNGTGWIVDLTTDTRTQMFGTVSHIDGSSSITAIGSKILVGGSEPFIDVLDGTKPAPPVIQTMPIGGMAFAMTGDDATAYAALYSSDEAVGVWQKPGTTGDLEPRNTFEGMSGPVAVRIWGRRLYICNNTNGTVVIADIPEGGAVVAPALLQSVTARAGSVSSATTTSSSSGATVASTNVTAAATSTSTATATSSAMVSGGALTAAATSKSEPSTTMTAVIRAAVDAPSASVSEPVQGGALTAVQVDSLNQVTVPIPATADAVDVVALGGGGGGEASRTASVPGTGGSAGSWATAQWYRGATYGAGSVIVVQVGKGGNGGELLSFSTAGSNSTASVGATQIVANGGASGNVPVYTNYVGASPGNQTFQGVQYVGGVTAADYSVPGGVPGGGGGGARAALIGTGTGGGGGQGRVWLRFHSGPIFATSPEGYVAATKPLIDFVSPPEIGEWEQIESGYVPLLEDEDDGLISTVT